MNPHLSVSAFTAQQVVLVGSGQSVIAALHRLLHDGAHVQWFPQDLDIAEEIWLEGRPQQIEVAFHDLRPTDLKKASTVVIAADDPLASKVAALARNAGCPVTVANASDRLTLPFDGNLKTEIAAYARGSRKRRMGLGDRVAEYLTAATAAIASSLPASFGI